ncbi:MAG: ATP-binding protein [Oscillospiraceae bacterium]|nr:ATP-binding protein [Oscillospiraceae bacterium]
MNPFKKSPTPLRRLGDLYDREYEVKQLEECLVKRENTVILGVEGSGKTSLIKSFFDIQYRKKMALEQQTLILFTDLSQTADEDELCDRLFGDLKLAVMMLLAGTSACDIALTLLERLWADPTKDPKARFESAAGQLSDQMGYYLVLIMDGFERFVSSPTITFKHHDMLLGLINQHIMQCIVATNYDLDKDSLPPDVGGSLYLQKFQNKIHTRAFSPEKATGFVRDKLRNNEIQLSDEEIKQLYQLTGGVPSLFELACSHSYDNVKVNGRLRQKEIGSIIYSCAKPVMSSWCKILSPGQMDLLHAIFESDLANLKPARFRMPNNDNAVRSSACQLEDRGLLVPHLIYDEHQKKYIPDEGEYQINSTLLDRYLRTEPARDNPLQKLRQEKKDKELREQAAYEHAERMKALEEATAQANLEHIKNSQPAGDTYNYYDLKGANVYNMTANLISADQFLGLLGIGERAGPLGRTSLRESAAKLRVQLDAMDTTHLLPPADIVEAEDSDQQQKEHALELQLAKASKSLLPDVDPASLEETNLESMDQRFHAVRAALGLEEQLNDHLMESLSPLCNFYVKAAIIVEDHMRPIVGLLNGDYSTHLVMYGKCLEQCLRDSLFPLFSTHPLFKDYNTYARKDTPGNVDTFAQMDVSKVMLGNFSYMLRAKTNQLSNLCVTQGIQVDGVVDRPLTQTEWMSWWSQYENCVHHAKDIRNRVHAGVPAPSEADVLQLRNYTFGNNGILNASQVGRALYFRINAPTQRQLTDREIADLKGTEQDLVCKSVNDKGALDGELLVTIEDCCVMGHVAAKHVRNLTSDAQSLVSQTLRVKLEQYDKQNNWFVVTLR